MSFTDEDIKRISAGDPMNLQDLLARLEAAEKVLREIEIFNNGILSDTSEFREWRKAAGKEKP